MFRAREHYGQWAKERTIAGKKTPPVEGLPQGPAKARDEFGEVFGVSGEQVEFAAQATDTGTRNRSQVEKPLKKQVLFGPRTRF